MDGTLFYWLPRWHFLYWKCVSYIKYFYSWKALLANLGSRIQEALLSFASHIYMYTRSQSEKKQKDEETEFLKSNK